MYFKIIGEVSNIETIASGRGIRRLGVLKKRYGGSNWYKKKGTANVQFLDGSIRLAEVHW
jgi:hypothetical protein